MSRIGFSLSLVTWGVTMIAGSLLLVVIDPAIEDVLAAGQEHTSGASAASGLQAVSSAWDAAPFITLLLGFVMLIAAAAARGGYR